MGICEREEYAHGTNALMLFLSDLTSHGATTIVCGGETVAAVEREQHRIRRQEAEVAAGLSKHTAALQESRRLEFSHVSMGGGAALELLAGKELPGVAVLADKV
jgi:phosphoglycerate kinase